MDILNKKQDLINSLSKKDKVAIAISVIEDEIKELEKQLSKTKDFSTRGMISQMIYELDSAKNHL